MTLVDKLDLSNDEIERGKYRESRIEWHPTMVCPECGDRMFLWGTIEEPKWVCRSNLYMEGGC